MKKSELEALLKAPTDYTSEVEENDTYFKETFPFLGFSIKGPNFFVVNTLSNYIISYYKRLLSPLDDRTGSAIATVSLKEDGAWEVTSEKVPAVLETKDRRLVDLFIYLLDFHVSSQYPFLADKENWTPGYYGKNHPGTGVYARLNKKVEA